MGEVILTFENESVEKLYNVLKNKTEFYMGINNNVDMRNFCTIFLSMLDMAEIIQLDPERLNDIANICNELGI